MKSLETLLKEGTRFLEEEGIEEARLDAWLLLEYITQHPRAWYFAHKDETVSESQEARYKELIKRRARHEPVQYLTHQACFMGLDFYVDERVLIPRQDTEVVAEEALRILKGKKHPRILDLCTGSGCILLSLLWAIPDASGTGTDLSKDALFVARMNGEKFGVNDRADWVQSDAFSADFFEEKDGNAMRKYDILISNPPYIPRGELGTLMEEVKSFEPECALDGGEDGLDFYREITPKARMVLKEGGTLLFEIGWNQGKAVTELLTRWGFTGVRVLQDLCGLDRAAAGIWGGKGQ